MLSSPRTRLYTMGSSFGRRVALARGMLRGMLDRFARLAVHGYREVEGGGGAGAVPLYVRQYRTYVEERSCC